MNMTNLIKISKKDNLENSAVEQSPPVHISRLVDQIRSEMQKKQGGKQALSAIRLELRKLKSAHSNTPEEAQSNRRKAVLLISKSLQILTEELKAREKG